MLQVFQAIAMLSAAFFAGAALYINLAEHPARMGLDTRSAAAQWASSYKRATWMQAPLALISLVSGTGAWLLSGHPGWLAAAVLVGAVVPFTLVVIMPTNKELLSPGRDTSSGETRQLLVRWGKLHSVRTVLSLIGTLFYLFLILHT